MKLLLEAAIKLKSDCREYENLILHNKGLKPTPPIGNKMVKKRLSRKMELFL